MMEESRKTVNSSSNHRPFPATDQSTLACFEPPDRTLAHVPCHGLRLARSSFPLAIPCPVRPTHDMSGNVKRSKRVVPRHLFFLFDMILRHHSPSTFASMTRREIPAAILPSLTSAARPATLGRTKPRAYVALKYGQRKTWSPLRDRDTGHQSE